MSVTSNTDEEWEFSKENIQPLQRGRKPDILKLALREHPEDPIQLQQQAFENELRTYSGNDPISVWFKYIHWVEQNFLKGGRDGHYELLVKKCVNLFKDDTRYCDDKRFITIWLKFANTSEKPVEVFNYMFSHNIGCYTACFYMAWSWELEQQDNIKIAHQVLQEGINRNADPVEKLKSYLSEFEMRVSQKITNLKCEPSPNDENHRSAFNILRTRRKAAPVERAGDAVMQPARSAMTIGQSQPAPRHERESNSKMPFKIYSNKAPAPSLPVQKVGNLPFIFHTDSVKENEMRPSKWNKVKLKQTIPISRPSSSKDLNFDFHQDETPQPDCIPRIVPKVSDVLRSRQQSKSPPMALFEPLDPMKCPMYDRNKVYGGAEEFSLEEVRAAAWFKKSCLLEPKKCETEENSRDFPDSNKNVGFAIYSDENKLTSLGHQKNSISRNDSPVRVLLSPINSMKCPIYDRNMFYKGKEELSFEEIKSKAWLTSNEIQLENNERVNQQQSLKRDNPLSSTSIETTISTQIQEAEIKSKLNVASFNSINNSNLKDSHNQYNSLNKQFEKLSSENNLGMQNLTENMTGKYINSTSYCEAANMLAELYNGTIANPVDAIMKNEYNLTTGANHSIMNNTNVNPPVLPFTLFRDPTENILEANKVNMPDLNPNNANEAKLPFELFQDHVDNNFEQNNMNVQMTNNMKQSLAFAVYEDPVENILKNPIPESQILNLINDENAENIPPKDYVQDTNKREISGILTPAQNIMFVPLELQECEDEDTDPEDIQINECALQNETLVPPCNTEQFVSAAFISSTPFTSAKNSKKANLQISEDTYNYAGHISNTKRDAFVPEKQAVTQHPIDRPVHRPEKTNGAFRPVSSLSVIMETSKESCKSSASSGSSASATRLSQFDQYHSYDKSNLTHKECSRADTFKEPKPVGIEHNISNFKKIVQVSDICIEKPKPILQKNVDDPFDNALTEKLLQSLEQPANYHKIMDISDKAFRSLKIGDNVEIKNKTYLIESIVAEGSYGKVFVAQKISREDNFSNQTPSKVALKACKHSNEWELYICFTLQERLLQTKSTPNVNFSVMEVFAAKKYSNGLILMSEYCPRGTLLDLVNIFKKDKSSVPEPLVLYIALELLQSMAKIHECKIIHTDIKPDNILIRNIPEKCEFIDQNTSLLQFIDFGRSIDLNFFENGVCFNTPMKNRCSEILEHKPWVFQLDWYGILDCIHTLLFLDYMKVRKNDSGRWCLVNRLKRYQATEIWSPLFDELLNIPSCYDKPNISGHVNRIKEKLQVSDLKFIFSNLQKMYQQK